MTLVTFNENIDHYVKGDVVDLDAAELKRVDAYAKTNDIEKPYAKGAKKVSNTSDTASLADQAREESLKNGGRVTSNVKNDDEGTVLKGDDETEAATELENDTDEPAEGSDKAKPATAPKK